MMTTMTMTTNTMTMTTKHNDEDDDDDNGDREMTIATLSAAAMDFELNGQVVAAQIVPVPKQTA